MAQGAWQEALDLLRAERAGRPLGPHELELLAQAAYAAGGFEAAITAFEQAHRAYLEAGAQLEAAGAAVSVALHLLMDTGLMAPVRGWLARAERLLQGRDETPVHAWLAMVRIYERLLSGDVPRAGLEAEQAIAIGTRQGTPATVAIGQMALARMMIIDGHVEEGLALLDEAAVATISGDLDPIAAGVVYCELICAMQGLAQYDRAEQWTDAMERWREGNAVGAFGGRCRVHRAEILRLRGSCEEAEAEALHACDELRPWMRREFGWPLTELGTIRLRKGDLAGAEQAFLAAHEKGWDPNPGLALLRLAQGDVASAGALIRDALERPRRVPSKERPPYGLLPRAPLLDAQVEIALAAGETEVAARAAGELDEIAAAYGSRAFAAAAALAGGRVALARGDADAACDACDEAVAIWSDIGAPFEVAVARMALAEAHRAQGNEDQARLELRAARSSFERLGASLKAQEAAGRSGEDGGQRQADHVFRCVGDTRTIAFAGRTVLLKDLKGMRYLARLLAEPGREFHVLDLIATEHAALPATMPVDEGLAASYGGGTGPVIDDQAVRAYKRRLAEIEEDLDEAKAMGDLERLALTTADRDYLIGELSRAFGLGGRQRPSGDPSERARASVTRAVRYALARIREHTPVLAEHLQHTVHTGTYCSYTPDPRARAAWLL
jgi:tetratricopeptide (TPR) repeat protein